VPICVEISSSIFNISRSQLGNERATGQTDGQTDERTDGPIENITSSIGLTWLKVMLAVSNSGAFCFFCVKRNYQRL